MPQNMGLEDEVVYDFRKMDGIARACLPGLKKIFEADLAEYENYVIRNIEVACLRYVHEQRCTSTDDIKRYARTFFELKEYQKNPKVFAKKRKGHYAGPRYIKPPTKAEIYLETMEKHRRKSKSKGAKRQNSNT